MRQGMCNVICDGEEIHGLFRCASDYAKSRSANVRIDTHTNNLVMQKLIESNGYTRCGTIYVADGSPRIAYHYCPHENAELFAENAGEYI